MNKTRGCFITFIIIVLVAVIFLIFFIYKNPKTENKSVSESTKIESKDLTSDNKSSETSLNLTINNIYNDNSDDYLFLGIDERENQNKFEGRTDTIIIYHIGSNGIDALISIPRDTKVELKGHGTNKINAAYEYGGANMISDEIYKLTDIGIDKVMVVNFAGFKKIIDTLGGVKITITEPLHDSKSGSNFDPGTYNFNGDQALAFVRNRATAKGDFDRMNRQKYLLSELFKQKANFSIISKIPSIIKILREETKSDFSTWDYLKIGFRLIKNKNNLKLLTLPGKTKTINNISYVIVNDKEAKAYLRENLNLNN
ncbi:MAG: LCP family protein [Actinobacteria bacterium]|nr:LCP family protein [Cyanobacteriota bacterium]MCL5771570.1 LCP family protein [Actinomycetota bacterium]